MSGMGLAMMGTGDRRGRDRAIEAAKRAISSPLLEDASVNGARGVIINVTGGPDLSLLEVSEALVHHPGSGARGRQHHLRRGGRSDAEGQGEDHRDRHRLRPSAPARTHPGDAPTQTPVDLIALRRAPARRPAPAPHAIDAATARRRGCSIIAPRRSLDLPHGSGGAVVRRHAVAGVGPRAGRGRPRPSSSTCRRSCAARKRSRASRPMAVGTVHGTGSAPRARRRRSGSSHGDPARSRLSPYLKPPGNQRDARTRRPSRKEVGYVASRTAIGCAWRSRSPTPTSSGCRTSASRRSTACSTPRTTSSASASSCRPSRNCRRCVDAGTRARHARVADAGRRLRRLAFSVSFEWDYTNVLTLLRLAGMPLRAAERDHRHPLVVIGGAVTFVNPEPLAPFADVIAAGEGEALVPALLDAVARRHLARRPARAAGPASAASTFRRSTTCATHADGTIAALRAARRHRRAAGRAKAALKTTEARRPAGDDDLHARHRVRLALPRSRSCAAAPTCAGSAGPATTTCRCARFPTDRILELAAGGARARRTASAWCRSRCATTRTSSRSSRAARDGLLDQPGVAAPRRPDADDRARCSARAASAPSPSRPETGSDRLRRVINKTVTNDEILDRADLIFASGIENLKLYYMIGLPTETDDDLVAIRDLTLQLRDLMLKHATAPRPHRPHRRQREPADSQAGHRLPVAADGGPDGHRAQDQAPARADGRHRQRATSTSSPSGTPTTRRCCRSATAASRRPSRPPSATAATGGGRARVGRRRRLLHLPRPVERRGAAVGHHRRRHEGLVLPRRVRQGPARGVDAAAEAAAGERAPAADAARDRDA